jgi:hypothetical protein
MNSFTVYGIVALLLVIEMLLIASIIDPPVNADSAGYIAAGEAYNRNPSPETEQEFLREKEQYLAVCRKLKHTNRLNVIIITVVNSAAVLFLIVYTFRKKKSAKSTLQL